MKKILFLIVVLFTGAFLYFLTKQTDYNIQNKYEDNQLLLNRNQKSLPPFEKSFVKIIRVQKVDTSDLLPIQPATKHSSRHRKGKIVYIQK